MTEKQFHRDFEKWLRERRIPFVTARMDRRSTIGNGKPDYCVTWMNRCVYVELKTAKGRLSPAQIKEIEYIRRSGNTVEVARGMAEAKEAVHNILCEGKPATGAYGACNYPLEGCFKELKRAVAAVPGNGTEDLSGGTCAGSRKACRETSATHTGAETQAAQPAQPAQNNLNAVPRCYKCGEVTPLHHRECANCRNARTLEYKRKGHWSKTTPNEQRRARVAVNGALRSGRLVKPEKCERCNELIDSKHLHAHHPDYSKRFDVIWLCRVCHSLEHKLWTPCRVLAEPQLDDKLRDGKRKQPSGEARESTENRDRTGEGSSMADSRGDVQNFNFFIGDWKGTPYVFAPDLDGNYKMIRKASVIDIANLPKLP
jgi:hypothetical protein